MRNIIITGGELFNKGAQAMVFITVHELKKRYPEHDIYVLSELDLKRPDNEKSKYAFKFTGWYPVKYAKAQSNFLLRMMCKFRNNQEYMEAYNLYSNCDLMLDISGYALGSNWSYATCNRYIEHIEFAKAFNIPVYLMPQSFGPFNFIGEKAKELNNRVHSALSYASAICAREAIGYEQLKEKYALDNLMMSYDLVLNNKGIDIDNVYMQKPNFDLPVINENSVGIVPNGMVLTVNDKNAVLNMYCTLIHHLIDIGYKVYILSHSSTDAELCNEIFTKCNNENVCLLKNDFSCIEFDELVKSFEFIIASRFHSIVHAYKNGVPCVLLGWAEKYLQLSELFEQEKYCLDMREPIDADKTLNVIEALNNNKENEKTKLSKLLVEIQKENVFDILPKEL